MPHDLHTGPLRPVLLLASVALLACTGEIARDDRPGAPGGDPAGGSPTGPTRPPGTAPAPTSPTTPPTTPPAAPPASATSVGPMPLSRLTQHEYENTVRDLFGTAELPALVLPADAAGGHGFLGPGLTSDVDVRNFMESAELLAARVSQDPAALLGCAPQGTAEDGCVKGFIERFGQRAYRRPLSAAEIDAHLAFYRDRRRTEMPPVATATLVQAFLQSPFFLYHWEQQPAKAQAQAGVVKLGGYHVASRLSYFLWRTMPDQALFQAAASGALDRPDGIRREVERLMKDKRFRTSLTSFHRQWLDLEKVPGLMRDGTVWTSGVPLAAAAETERFLEHVLLEADGRVETMLGARYSFVNKYVARIYGLPATESLELVKTDLPAGRRGLLTQGSLLALNAKAGETSPILRGLMVRTKVICQGLPQPPAEIPELKPPAPNLSTRERHIAHSTEPACRGCHQMIDEVGFAFEGFDQAGRVRTTDGGKPVDTRGTLRAVDGMDRTFDGAEALIDILAKSPEVKACVARQWMRYALGRGETQADAASFDAAIAAARAAGDDLRAFIAAFASAPTFTHRAAAQGE